MATSLDVLSKHGNSAGTLSVVSHILGIEKNAVFDKQRNLTLEKYFLDFYSEGRSKFVHGAYADRFDLYEEIRNKAFIMVRGVLIEALYLIKNYTGEDHDKGFKYI